MEKKVIVKSKKKGLMQLPVLGYGVATGIHPNIAVFYKTLLDKPAISWGNVGLYPKNSQFNMLKKEIKALCGFGWANTIESLYYYDGAHNFYRFGFHVQLFFKEQKHKNKIGSVPVVKTLYKYEICLYNPIDNTSILTVFGDLKHWNSKFDAAHIDRIGKTMKLFIDTCLNTAAQKQLVADFRNRT